LVWGKIVKAVLNLRDGFSLKLLLVLKIWFGANMNKGIWFGIGAYGIWGLFPIYWKLIHGVPPLQTVAHRLSWSLVFLAILVTILREWKPLRKSITGRALAIYALAAVLLTLNWAVYIWAVDSGFVVETSLGYFINPLVNVMLGVIFMGERLSVLKWIPVGIATAGVVYLTVSYGSLPWISLALAFSFGLYGLIKKLSPLGALHGLTVETAILFIPAVGFLIFSEVRGVGAFGHISTLTTILLAMAGLVTALPLLLFSGAARSIPLSTLGLLQYIAPTLQFLLGVFAYGEPFTQDRLIGFSIIWAALILLTVGGFYERRKALVTEPVGD
jgi:chloramphenicol-sensitive protein RarD